MDEARLRELLGAEPDPAVPMGGRALLSLARRRSRTRTTAVSGSLLLGLVAVALLLGRDGPAPDLATRGGSPAPLEVDLLWVTEGDVVERGGTSPVEPGEQVVFVARISRAAWLCLDERDGEHWKRVYPREGELWQGQPGDNLPMANGAPLAFTTDLGPGAREYRLLADPEDAACREPAGSDVETVKWRPAPGDSSGTGTKAL